MTLLSRRKRRTTVRSITPGTTAAKAAALLLALLAAPALAQPPGTAPKAQPGGNQPPAAKPGGLPLPPGYRPRTPPPQAQPASAPIGARPGSAGKMMYFQKPADALVATGEGLSALTGQPEGAVRPADGVAQSNAAPAVVTIAAPDVPVVPALPAPIPARPGVTTPAVPLGGPAPVYFPPPAASAPPAGPVGFATQPPPGDMTSTSDKKKQNEPLPIDPKEIKLPPREKIFAFVYNDPELEKAIMEAISRDQAKNNPKIVIPPESLVFPTLPEIIAPGTVYQSKTPTYAPRTLSIEPGYVVHRRLHFEEKNAERQGWDLGPLSTLVGAATFYRNVLLWPGSLATGCTSGFWDTSAGKCLPGSPSPYYLYPPGLSTAGWAAEAGIITGFTFVFP